MHSSGATLESLPEAAQLNEFTFRRRTIHTDSNGEHRNRNFRTGKCITVKRTTGVENADDVYMPAVDNGSSAPYRRPRPLDGDKPRYIMAAHKIIENIANDSTTPVTSTGLDTAVLNATDVLAVPVFPDATVASMHNGIVELHVDEQHEEKMAADDINLFLGASAQATLLKKSHSCHL